MKQDQTVVENILDDAAAVVGSAEQVLKHAAAPVKEHVFKRFPVLFILATTLGVTMVILSVEQLLLASWFGQHPLVSLFIGVLILVATGTVYKKL